MFRQAPIALLLTLAAVASAHDLRLGPEVPVTSARRIPSSGEWGPIAASDGDSFLVVAHRPPNRIVATRVSPRGEVLDPNGIEISSTSGMVDVEFVNGRYVVIMANELIAITTDGRVGARQPLTHAVRGLAAAAGSTLAIPGDIGDRRGVAMYVPSGDQFVLQRFVDFGTIHEGTMGAVHRLGAGFAVIQSANPCECNSMQAIDVTGAFAGARQEIPLGTRGLAASASNGAEVLFAWVSPAGGRLRSATASRTSAETAFPASFSPRVYALGSEFAVRVSDTVSTVRANPDPVVVASVTDRFDPLASNGRDVLHVANIAGRLVARTGNSGAEVPLFFSDAERGAIVLTDGIGATFAAWEERTASGSWDVRGAIVRPGQQPVEVLIQQSARRPAVAFDGRSFIVAYRIGTEFESPFFEAAEVGARRVGPDGTLFAPIAVGGGLSTLGPAIGAANGEAFVVWGVRGTLVGARIAADDRVIDQPPLLLDPQRFQRLKISAAVAWSGIDWAVGWSEQDIPTFIHIAYAIRVAPHGAVTMPAIEITRGWDSAPVTLIASPNGVLVAAMGRSAQFTTAYTFAVLLLPNDGPPSLVRQPPIFNPATSIGGFHDGSGYVLMFGERPSEFATQYVVKVLRFTPRGDIGSTSFLGAFSASSFRVFRHGVVYATPANQLVFRYFVPPPRRRAA